ncbi:cation:proton antiporter [Actinocrispum wychmicini]|uniref:Kef-type K+ transport system membrane component KefB n=1 Tax=Actinocrispum wychmicini TaxID=1213861 RepID=A0A4R2IK15_9PSEU|nr:cation:proton antiporter [Actinocrispum wychmicini]TCO44752.1 Kef-type K+ transport system membrane component KefB [Actinocrispum wychmicini]
MSATDESYVTGVRVRRTVRLVVPYLGLVVVPVILGVLLLQTQNGGAATTEHPAATDPFAKLLFAVPVIFVACRVVAWLFGRIGQPPVIGEIVAGILLGPSLLGWVWPAGYGWLFPAYLAPAINMLAQVGLVLFMFLVGHELNLALLRRRTRAAVMVSHASIALPFLAGILLALQMYKPLGGGVQPTAFALFIAVSMSITAFPVLARILTDRKMNGQPLASLALTCAAVDDVTAWCLLALVTAIATGTSVAATALTVLLSLVFFALMIFVVRPLLDRLLARRVIPDGAVLPVLLAGLMLAALATNSIGIHPIFGAFLFGVITPRGVLKVERATDQMRGLTMTFLLPLFFVYTGLRTKFGLLGDDWGLWGWCALITAVAIVAKWAGSLGAARLSGVGWRESWGIGALMNCRGLTELVVLNIGLDLKIISPTVFAMLVIMTLVTTMLTAPALTVIERFLPDRAPAVG